MIIMYLFHLLPLLCILFLHPLSAAWDTLFSDDEDLCLFEHVNVITGHFNFSAEDAEVRGAAPLHVGRSYTSAGALERTLTDSDLRLKRIRGGCLIQGGWSLFPHIDLLLRSRRQKARPP
jgi:hypothetical protein